MTRLRRHTVRRHRDIRHWYKKAHETGGGIFKIEVINCELLGVTAQEPSRIEALAGWVYEIPTMHPMCLLCEHDWTSREQLPHPHSFVFVKAGQQPGPQPWLLSAVCEDCARLPDLKGRATQAVMKLMPKSRIIPPPHQAPGRQQ
jgi:hypothetical protein